MRPAPCFKMKSNMIAKKYFNYCYSTNRYNSGDLICFITFLFNAPIKPRGYVPSTNPGSHGRAIKGNRYIYFFLIFQRPRVRHLVSRGETRECTSSALQEVVFRSTRFDSKGSNNTDRLALLPNIFLSRERYVSI